MRGAAGAGDDHPQARGRPRARAYSYITSGVRCAETMRTSCGDAELDEHVDRALHHRQVGVAAHDHADERRGSRGHGPADAERTTCNDGPCSTRLTEMLGIEHPVMLAGMGGVSYHARRRRGVRSGRLRHARRGDDVVRARSIEEMRGVRELTDKPFGVDLLAALPERMIDDAHKVVDGGASLFVAGLGVPRDVIKVLHDGNVLVASMCGKVRHAIAAVEAGCDFVIAQGTEAGGHTGTVATMPLVPQIVDAVGDRVPGRRRRRHLRRARARGRARARRRRRVARHALHRDARSAHRAPATRTRCCARTRTAR